MLSDTSTPTSTQELTSPLVANHIRENEGLQSADHDGRDAPQRWDPESEGLQSVDHDGRNGPQVVDSSPYSSNLAYPHYGNADDVKAEPTVYANEVTSARKQKRRRWIWTILVAVVVAIAVAVGVGAGVGLSNGKSSEGDSDSSTSSDSSESNEEGSTAHATTSPSSTTSSPSSSTTSSSIQTSVSGKLTGLAHYVCGNDTPAISADGNSYVEECNVYYPSNKNMIAPDSNKWLLNLPGSPVTTYSFIDCINQCDDYNSNNKPTDTYDKCYGVSYYANLTSAFRGSWGGNCFFKNGRGTGVWPYATGDDADHTASAYRHCLREGTPADCDAES